MVTPAHIVPEWYFLPLYGILRSILNKTYGIIIMFVSLLVLFLLPFIDKSIIKNKTFKPFNRTLFWFFAYNFLFLGYLGSQSPVYPYIEIGLTCAHFHLLFFFLFIPLSVMFENSFFLSYSKNINSNKPSRLVTFLVIYFFVLFTTVTFMFIRFYFGFLEMPLYLIDDYFGNSMLGKLLAININIFFYILANLPMILCISFFISLFMFFITKAHHVKSISLISIFFQLLIITLCFGLLYSYLYTTVFHLPSGFIKFPINLDDFAYNLVVKYFTK